MSSKVLVYLAAASLVAFVILSTSGPVAPVVPPGPPITPEQTDIPDLPPPGETLEKDTRNPRWAVPISKPPLENFHRITSNLYRGAQPDAEGMKVLEKMGIKTVLNLRRLHSDEDEIKDTKLKAEWIKTNAHDIDEDEAVQFLKIVTDESKLPVFFHCAHGADRTGSMCAVYRIVVQGWSKKDAAEEMIQGGYNYHTIWKNLPKFLANLDVEKVKQGAGLK